MIRRGIVFLANFGLLSVVWTSMAAAEDAAPPADPPNLPLSAIVTHRDLVSPARAAALLATRVVPPSGMPALPAEATRPGPPVVINVAPMLGHSLPAGETTTTGLRRAAFAIGKPAADDGIRKQRAAVIGAPVGKLP